MASTTNSADNRRYFDWAATAIPDNVANTPAVNTAFGNPSSPHAEGRAARETLEAARCRCAAVLNVAPETLYFTSGGTESNCIALYSNLAKRGGGRIAASEAEHSSVYENIDTLERMGKPVAHIPIDSSGRVTPALLEKTLDKYGDIRFAAIMAVNNETGTVNDIAALSRVLRGREGPPVHLHCDIVQAVGKIPLDIPNWDIDSAAVSAHKIGGPRGIGLLYLRRPLETLYGGGGQERRIRPGTENVAGAVALAACLERRAAPQVLAAEHAEAARRWQKLMDGLAAIERCRLIPAERENATGNASGSAHSGNSTGNGFSPYIVQAAFRDIPGEVMVRALDDLGFAVSTGSACSSARPDRPVLAAMGVDESVSLEGIRISQGWSTTGEDIDRLLEAIAEVLKFL